LNRELAIKVADAVLYEGYMLYPYRASALKNRQRWSFGILYPPDCEQVHSGTERSFMHSEFLLRMKANCKLRVNLRFLHLPHKRAVTWVPESSMPANNLGPKSDTWGEGIPHCVEFESDLCAELPQRFHFTLPDSSEDERTQGTIAHREDYLKGAVIVNAEKVGEELLKVSIDVRNETHFSSGGLDRDSDLQQSMLSAHLILMADGAEFVSLLDPPAEFGTHVSACRNLGNFPVLVGNEGSHDMMLCSPIILYDYPQIAPESAGDFYDCTEMDEMLTLRVMTLTDHEKNEMRSTGEQTRKLLERTERSGGEQLMKTHGTIRSMRPASEKDGMGF
jgi:hydrogenase maturation protease